MVLPKLLKNSERQSKFSHGVDVLFSKIEAKYKNILMGNMHKTGSVVLVLIFSGIASFLMFDKLPSELTPKEDRGTAFILMNGPQGASYENNAQKSN